MGPRLACLVCERGGQTHRDSRVWARVGRFGGGWRPFTGSGEVCGGDDPIFINEMAGWIANHNVQNAVFYDAGTSSIANGENPLTAVALKSDFGSAG